MKPLGTLYFNVFAAGNFLYPLAAGLSSFFTGRGKVKSLLIAILTTHILNIVLDLFLIFGVQGIIPPLGILGAAIATIFSQFTFCLILFLIFSKKQNIEFYRTDQWPINWIYMLQILKKGIPHSFGRIIALSCWLFASYIMISKGGNYLLILSFGTTLYLAFSFVTEGLAQTIVTIVSYKLGRNLELLTLKTFRSSLMLLMCYLMVLILPFFLFKNLLISTFIKNSLPIESKNLLSSCCVWMWLALLTGGFYKIASSLIIAAKDTLFFSSITPFMWIIYYLPILIGIGHLGWPPQTFFIIGNCMSCHSGNDFFTAFLKINFGKITLIKKCS